MTDPDLIRDEISKLPGEDGWFHEEGREAFMRLLDDMLSRGFHPDDALALLSSAYSATAAEFGA